MAEQLKLVLIKDDGTDVDYVDLLPYVAHGGYEPVTADSGAERVDESIMLHPQGSSMDDLKTKVAALYAKRMQMERSLGALYRYRVAIRVQAAGESNPRQAYLTAMKFGKSQPYGLFLPQSIMDSYQFGFTRTAAWESPTERAAGNQYGSPVTHIDALGGTWRLASTGTSLTVNGDVPARLRRTYIHSSVAAMLYEVWLGWKTDRYSDDYGYFVPYWSLRKASVFGTDTTGGTSHADVTAKDGYRVECTFATQTTLVERLRISVADVVASHYDGMIGSYKILLRAKAYGGLVARVRVGSGYVASNDFTRRPRVKVNKPYWYLYDLGTVSIPNAGGGAFFDEIANAGLIIDAEKASGGGSAALYLDGIILIPVSDGALHVLSAAQIGTTMSGVNSAYVASNPDGTIIGRIADTSALRDSFVPDASEWNLPLGGPIMVAAGTPGGGSAVGDTLDVTLGFHERWLTLRGADV